MSDTCKYIFITGGVTSSLGKGIIASSLATLLKERNYRVTIQKIDPYLNVDPGTINPYEHGECYVTEDGAETDLDLGHYERFTEIITSQANNFTTGKIYQSVIDKERKGEFLGKTVQIIPHITNEIKENIKQLGKNNEYDIVITEIGGTVGDIESLPFIESVRQLKWELEKNALVLHLTYLPYLSASKELKTKPTQHSVKTLLEAGVQPDILLLRTEHKLTSEIRQKLSLFCNVNIDDVIEAIDVESIYEVPVKMYEERLDKIVLQKFRLPDNEHNDILNKWNEFLYKLKKPNKGVTIALVGKYVELPDAYKSIAESFIHAAAANNCKVNVKWIHSENINSTNVAEILSQVNGILVAPGFGSRGIEGKIHAVKYARKSNTPFLGICLGFQASVIEFTRNVLQLKNANSTEIDNDTPYPVINLMEKQKSVTQKGGTMRLGLYNCKLKKKSKVYKIYGKEIIRERHRHRYELNNNFIIDLEKNNLQPVGINPDTNLVEIIELTTHPWFIGTQFHPEYNSTVNHPHPLFKSFIKATLNNKEQKTWASHKA